MAPVVGSQGVFQDQLNQLGLGGLAASPVTIDTGRALVNGIWYENNAAAVDVAIPTPAANPRIDRIVLRADWAPTQTVRITRIAGAEGAVPVPPAITQNDGVRWDLPLWQVLITVAPALSVYADEREFIGQYEPHGLSATKVYVEWDCFTGISGFASGTYFGSFIASYSANAQVAGLSLAGFGGGGLVFSHTGGGAGTNALLISNTYRPDAIDARVHFRAKSPNTHANLDRVMGFVSANGTLTPAEGVYFRADGAGNWFAVARSGGVEAGTATDTGQAQDDTWRDFEIRQTNTSVVEFLIDGVVVATHQANIPADQALSLSVETFDNGVAPGNLAYHHLDYVQLRGTR
jgi:hypothetical protein